MQTNKIQIGWLLAFLALLSGIISSPVLAQSTPPTAPTLNSKGEGEILTGIWPRALAFDGANIWVINGFDDTVLRLDDVNGRLLANGTTKVGKQPTSMAWAAVQNTMWVAGYDDFSLTLVDGAGKVTQTLSPQNGNPLDGHPISMTFAGGFVWVVTQDKDGLTKFDPLSLKPVKKIAVGHFPTTITASPDGKTLWVANGNDDSISVIDTTKDGGTVTATYTENVPPFPISLTFDGRFLWVGSYDCSYKEKEKECKESKVAKLNAADGKVVATNLTLPGRQVAVFYLNGHVWVANAHMQSMTNVNSQTNQEDGLVARTLFGDRDASYTGAVLATTRFVYMADWLNDRLKRIAAPGEIVTFTPAPTGTSTPIPTATAIPPTEAPCNPNPDFPPRLQTGDKARVIREQNSAENVEVNVREKRSLSAKIVSKLTVDSPPFNIVAGPKPSEDTEKEKLCWYEIETADKSLHGFVIEGGRAKEPDKTRSRYYLEKAPAQ